MTIKEFTIFVLLLLTLALAYYMSLDIKHGREMKSIHENLHECRHAPTPIEIGDSLYLIRKHKIGDY